MSTAHIQSTETPGSLLTPGVLTPGRPTQLWVHGPLEIVTHPYHINDLSSLTVAWCANHTVMSTSISVTFPHDASTHFFPVSVSSSHLFSRAASLLGYTIYPHSLPAKSIAVLSRKEVLYFMLVSQSQAVYVFLCDGYPRKQQPQLFSESSGVFQLYQATEWVITGSELGQHVLEWLLSIEVYLH